MKKIKLTEQDILNGIKSGMNVETMAKAYGVCTSTIRNSFHRYGIQLPETDYHNHSIKEDELKECIAQGMSAMQMSVHFGKDVTTVRKYLHKYGLVPKNTRGKYHRVKYSNEDDLMKDAIFIKHERKAPVVEVDGKQYRNTFELMWAEPKEENPYKYVGKKKPIRGLYG